MKTKVKIIIKGFVQGVGYRYYCYRKAVEYGITGYAKNLNDGQVEVSAEGEQSLIYDFIKELKIGNAGSKVNSVNIKELPFENEYEEFKIF